MKTLPRRTAARRLALAATGAMLAPVSFRGLIRTVSAEGGKQPTASELQAFAGLAREFMEKFEVPGMSVAFGRHGQLLHEQGFGLADKTARTAVTPAHAFRIASVSKPITAATTFAFIERGELGLDDLVFGERGRLGFDYGKSLPAPVTAITVRHLLTHTSGGWGNKKNDPMFRDPALSQREIIEWTLKNAPLEHAPGTSYAYSNFGYCVLGRLLEKLSGLPYA